MSKQMSDKNYSKLLTNYLNNTQCSVERVILIRIFKNILDIKQALKDEFGITYFPEEE